MTSLRTRLLVSLLATLAVAALVLGVAAYRNVLGETERLFDYQLRQMALSLRDQGEIAPPQAGAFADAEFDFVVQIWSLDGRTVYASRPYPELPSRVVLGFADVAVQGRPWRTYAVATPLRVIQVAQPVQIRRRLAARSAFGIVVPLLAVAPLLAAAVWGVVGLAVKPLERLARDVRARDAEALQPIAPDARLPDEVAPLVQALDALLKRLEAAFAAQRAFVADAAHELRSPLTALRLQVARLRRARDDAARASALAALDDGVARSVRLVEQMLVLARSEPAAGTTGFGRIDDLGELVREALADTVPQAAARGTDLALDAVPGVALDGDRAALAALVRNLADNAVRHAPPGAHVQVRVAPGADGTPLLTVDDDGPGIPAAERERVFDRFYRRETSASDDGAQGSGLGLAIVRRVAERHGATVALDTAPLGGLRVAVRFGRQATTGIAGTGTALGG